MSFGDFGRPSAPPAMLGEGDAGLTSGASGAGAAPADAMRYGVAVLAFGVGMIAGGLTTWAALRQDRAR